MMLKLWGKSFKIEGRMRSIYYVATVLNVYRRAIDEYSNASVVLISVQFFITRFSA